MHNLMITNSWQYFIGLNKCKTIGEKNIQVMVASNEDIECVKKAIVFNSPVHHKKNSWVAVAWDSISFPVNIRNIRILLDEIRKERTQN